jgi:signal transduction histidine kinase
MSRPPLRLHYRIVIPFVVVALLATSAAALVALSVISRTLRSRVQARTLSTALVVSRRDYALNPLILRSVKEITDADVVTYAANGAVLVSTLESTRSGIASRVVETEAARQALASHDAGAITRELSCNGVPCFVAFRPVSGGGEAAVAVIAEMSEVGTATSAITRALLLAMVVTLAAVVVVSQLLTRRVTAPLEGLVAFTHHVAGSDSSMRAPIGDDEVGRLGASFNEMLDRLQQSREALVRSEKLGLAGLLAARVAHDIRNPLSSMRMQMQLLEARLRSPDDRAAVTAVLHSIATVESVIRDLLELARSGELRRAPGDLNTVVRELLDHLQAQLAHQKIRIDCDLDAGLPMVSVDQQRVTQALHNLVVNAADAMPDGGVLLVRTRYDRDGRAVTVDVCDDGCGIDPAIGNRVFDPFVSTKRDGVGLGLVNVKAVIERHGGRIELTPRAPRGTQASITLPVQTESHG